MVISSPFVIRLTGDGRQVLTGRVRAARTDYRDWVRAQIVLIAAGGACNAAIAGAVGVCVDTVRKWPRSFTEAVLPGLQGLPRAGRPPVFTPVQVAGIKALACTPSPDRDVPLVRWSTAELADQAVHLVGSISSATIDR